MINDKKETLRDLAHIECAISDPFMLERVAAIRAYIVEIESSLALAIDQRNLSLSEHATTMRELGELESRATAATECQQSEFSSRVCQAGTKGCVRSHPTASVEVEGMAVSCTARLAGETSSADSVVGPRMPSSSRPSLDWTGCASFPICRPGLVQGAVAGHSGILARKPPLAEIPGAHPVAGSPDDHDGYTCVEIAQKFADTVEENSRLKSVAVASIPASEAAEDFSAFLIPALDMATTKRKIAEDWIKTGYQVIPLVAAAAPMDMNSKL